ncbi:MAG: hypothetical protein J0M09_15485 [Xanthomonadales bacterium]|nr:hypothetical protein [Xanthomonadales bacterium]
MKSIWNRSAAYAVVVLGLAVTGAAVYAWAQPDIGCKKMPMTCAASIELVQAQERFRIAYQMETGACSKVVACSTGVRPNAIGGRQEVLSVHAKNAVQSCETSYCDEQYKDDKQRTECRLACLGNKPIP